MTGSLRTLLPTGANLQVVNLPFPTVYRLETHAPRAGTEQDWLTVFTTADPRSRESIPIADNRRNYQVVVVPEQAGDLEATLQALGSLIEIGEADRRRVMRDAKRKHSFVPLLVRANLRWEEMARVEVARAFQAMLSGRQGPAALEMPWDVFTRRETIADCDPLPPFPAPRPGMCASI